VAKTWQLREKLGTHEAGITQNRKRFHEQATLSVYDPRLVGSAMPSVG
jgi:hypothetical protein